MINLNWFKILIIFASFGLTFSLAESYVASSSNYILQSDNINFSGSYSISSFYKLLDVTIGTDGRIYTSPTMILTSGYQAMSLDTYLSITLPNDPMMTPPINEVGVVGGTSNGSSIWRVQTDNPTGYELSIKADTSPALISESDFFVDYIPSFSTPDYFWNALSNESRFGFSPESINLVNLFLDNGVSCGIGSKNHLDTCWLGFSGNNRVIARSTLANYLNSVSIIIKFRAEVGAKKVQPKGVYQSNITVTVVAL